MPPAPIENYGLQSHDDGEQTDASDDIVSETAKTNRDIAAEIAALLEETPDYDDDDVPDDDSSLLASSAPLAPVRHKRRSRHSAQEEEDRLRRSSCFLTEIDQEEEGDMAE